jgi:hypothetical protein
VKRQPVDPIRDCGRLWPSQAKLSDASESCWTCESSATAAASSFSSATVTERISLATSFCKPLSQGAFQCRHSGNSSSAWLISIVAVRSAAADRLLPPPPHACLAPSRPHNAYFLTNYKSSIA